MRAAFRHPINRDALRARMERAVERLIAALDALDAAGEDLEDEFEDNDSSDREPYLAGFDAVGDDLEFDDGEHGIADWEGLCEQWPSHRGPLGERVEQ